MQRFLVLDEADRMLDDGFLEQMKDILRQCPPARRQTLLFSATMTENVCDSLVMIMEPEVGYSLNLLLSDR